MRVMGGRSALASLRRCLAARPGPQRGCASAAASCAGLPGLSGLLQGREWLLPDPSTQLTVVRREEQGGARLLVARDDLLHPYAGGNKLRKLDGLWADLAQATDVLACGGVQSAHAAAVAALAAGAGLRAHILLRGERPAGCTGHHLVTRMFAADVTYVSRSEYADRDAMLARHAERVRAGAGPTARVAVLPEGAAEPGALLGLLRLVEWLASPAGGGLGGTRCALVVDSGTGTTAAGLALGAALAGLGHWRVLAVMLAGEEYYYRSQQEALTLGFCAQHALGDAAAAAALAGASGLTRWVPRAVPRRFGKVLPGEVARCREVARETGVLLDPVWTLAAWEAADALAAGGGGGGAEEGGWRPEAVVHLHTGGSAAALMGLEQRFPAEF